MTRMRWITSTLSAIAVLTALLLAGAARADEKDGTLKVDGQFSVPAPAAGYTWQKLRDIDGPTVKGAMYVATKDDSDARVLLIVEYREQDTDAKRVATIKGAYNGLVHGLRDNGATELRGEPPSIQPPIPRHVSFIMTGKDKGGMPRAYGGAVVFGKRVYQFQVGAGSEDEAKKLLKVAESLKEVNK